MRGNALKMLAGIAVLSMGLSGCGAGGQSSAPKDDIITFGISEPSNPLVPGNTNERSGSLVVGMLFSGLVATKPDGSLVDEAAESVKANEDSSRFDVTLKSGGKFTDGTPVTSESFTKAWSYTANAKNGQLNSSFLSLIQGYDDLQKDGLKGDEQLSGLKVEDDTHFSISLNKPCSIFPTMLAYGGLAPLPESFYKDPKAFGEKPVGNGPYKFKAWKHGESIEVVPNPDYTGYYKPKNDGLTYKVYTDPKSEYADVQAGNLDVAGDVPATALRNLMSDKRLTGYSESGPRRLALGIPMDLAHFSGKEGTLRRRAISLALDRDAICTKIMNGMAEPAKDFSSKVIDGYSDSLKGNDVLSHDETKAKELWAQADAISPFEGQFVLSYSADDTNKDADQAIANELKNALGIDVKLNVFATKQEYKSALSDGKLNTAYNDYWGPDYPALENYLAPVYSTSAYQSGSNRDKYLNPEFDALLDKAASAASIDEANKTYQQAEEILLRDLPSIPIYNYNTVGAAANGLKSVQFNWGGDPVLAFITKN